MKENVIIKIIVKTITVLIIYWKLTFLGLILLVMVFSMQESEFDIERDAIHEEKIKAFFNYDIDSLSQSFINKQFSNCLTIEQLEKKTFFGDEGEKLEGKAFFMDEDEKYFSLAYLPNEKYIAKNLSDLRYLIKIKSVNLGGRSDAIDVKCFDLNTNCLVREFRINGVPVNYKNKLGTVEYTFTQVQQWQVPHTIEKLFSDPDNKSY